MLAILSAPGSRGDVNPMIAIGRQLRQLGVEVVISIADAYAELAADAGLDVEPIIAKDRFDALLSNPKVWTPIRGVRAIFRELGADFLRNHDAVIRKHHRAGETILVAHPLDFASRVHRDHVPSTPLVSVLLAPAVLRTFPRPRVTPWWFELQRPKWAVESAYWMVDQLAVDPVLRGPINRLRRDYDLHPIHRVLDRWWLSPDRLIAMFPAWFAPATEAFDERLTHVGFPLSDGDQAGDFAPPSNQPIVFTAGTAHHHCRDFFVRAVSACRALEMPGLLLSTHAGNFPDQLPPEVTTATYSPLGLVLPHCRAIVHHGGIGTTSQALAAGIPQIIRPLAFDQFDNATRVEQLGCGVWLRTDRKLAAVLAETLTSTSIGQNCRAISTKLKAHGAAASAAQQIVSLLR